MARPRPKSCPLCQRVYLFAREHCERADCEQVAAAIKAELVRIRQKNLDEPIPWYWSVGVLPSYLMRVPLSGSGHRVQVPKCAVSDTDASPGGENAIRILEDGSGEPLA